MSGVAGASGNSMTREERRKKREVEEARKAGTLPPEVDNEGNMINPHVPEFMSKAPWYLNQEDGAGLKHQKVQKSNQFDNRKTFNQAKTGFLKKGLIRGSNRKKWQKGACQNCGSMTHKTKDCVERPRKVGAKWNNKEIKEDEYIQPNAKLTFDAKRDRYAGYDPRMHQATINKFKMKEEERRRKRIAEMDKLAAEKAAKRAQKEAEKKERRERRRKAREARIKAKQEGKVGGGGGGAMSGEDSDSDDDSDGEDDDEDDDDDDQGDVKRDEASDTLFGKEFRVGQGTKMTVRNLRIREDTAKYLRNLDPNSAYYDPKTRSMRADPLPHIDPSEKPYAGDNFVKGTGEVASLAQTQVFAWDAYNSGRGDAHLMADPTRMAVEHKSFVERKEKLKESKRAKVLAKYGGEEHLNSDGSKMPRELLLGQGEGYVEYGRDGRVVKGQEASKRKSRFEEDVLELNHTKVWGSWYDRESRQWGYACCRQTQRRGYCTGAAGIAASEASRTMLQQRLADMEARKAAEAAAEAAREAKEEEEEAAGRKSKKKKAEKFDQRELYGEQLDPELDREKLRKALAKQDAELSRGVEMDLRKRKYNSSGAGGADAGVDVSAEDIEAYKLKRRRTDDPMMKGAGANGLLPLAK